MDHHDPHRSIDADTNESSDDALLPEHDLPVTYLVGPDCWALKADFWEAFDFASDNRRVVEEVVVGHGLCLPPYEHCPMGMTQLGKLRSMAWWVEKQNIDHGQSDGSNGLRRVPDSEPERFIDVSNMISAAVTTWATARWMNDLDGMEGPAEAMSLAAVVDLCFVEDLMFRVGTAGLKADETFMGQAQVLLDEHDALPGEEAA